MTPPVKVVGAILLGLGLWFGLVYLAICALAKSVE
jgi:hypothetical protein